MTDAPPPARRRSRSATPVISQNLVLSELVNGLFLGGPSQNTSLFGSFGVFSSHREREAEREWFDMHKTFFLRSWSETTIALRSL